MASIADLNLPRNDKGNLDIEVHYVNRETGERWVDRNPYGNLDENGEFEPFWWEDGSMGCDCNRSAGHGDYECNMGPNRVAIEKIVPVARPNLILYSEELT